MDDIILNNPSVGVIWSIQILYGWYHSKQP